MTNTATRIRIQCDCTIHKGKAAEVSSPIEAREGSKKYATMVHNLVNIAHHPFMSRAASVQARGPWAV